MYSNSLTREVGLKAGPILLENLIKHYFDRLKSDTVDNLNSGIRLKQDDILYDAAFTIAKAFLNAASYHTVEELQAFSNTRTPSPPWVHVVRVIIPLSACDDAASHLIKAMGGPEIMRRVVGGVKWWQVRGINGVDGQWITAKKDWREAKRRHKSQRKQKDSATQPPLDSDSPKQSDASVYEQSMDEMRCILYLHGGGYYFGSVDQERYSIQRLARKINGRVFAINYRLAPQYPFPCALQDALAAYIYLIRPPLDAAHAPVNPAHIVIAGDSAGGGLSLALLQVIRDSGLPASAGGILISPWCDLSHSFPSVHTNTATDVIPTLGLSFHKPSILWPPPSHEISTSIHASIRQRIRQTFKGQSSGRNSSSQIRTEEVSNHILSHASDMPIEVGEITPVPSREGSATQTIRMVSKSGENLEIAQQLHFYTQNNLLSHPLVSPALSYLGGLPPLLFIASDKEVLRDEIIYISHKAANPSKFPIKDHVRALYPALDGVEERHPKPTSVHLQVYDDAAHILPVLFSFTTPAKYCFRAMAIFANFVTGKKILPPSVSNLSFVNSPRVASLLKGDVQGAQTSSQTESSISPQSTMSEGGRNATDTTTKESAMRSKSLRHSLSKGLTRASSVLRKRPASAAGNLQSIETPSSSPMPPLPRATSAGHGSTTSSDVGGPRFKASSPVHSPLGERTAGDPTTYADIENCTTWDCPMIRERISTQGVIRPLEPDAELDALQVPADVIGALSERTIRRYINGRTQFDKKFSSAVKSIEKHRRHNLERSIEDTMKRMNMSLKSKLSVGTSTDSGAGLTDAASASPGCGWAWALEEEDPPPSSIASRRDTPEARKLAEVADHAMFGDDHRISGNNLWSVIVEHLTVTPGRENHRVERATSLSNEEKPESPVSKRGLRLSKLWN